ncbi:Phage tail tape-measure protein, controls tail length [Desulfotomaculum arcticum]|uniref:Phage tail tape-measure protein, controls tail length n=1 Tax=Desulfotruncus arcticus DSM 17038 TaxID=1121424 RepID=A0A1I2Y726_9FIRM|nr:hypothetical protein [Desulfotruncus arcticus]SFH21149.1 Phage tail tape-measure protein, controls tail length [Desulfotomaculum arcticum] [Desulfotruncus arcticus DSM 17038]
MAEREIYRYDIVIDVQDEEAIRRAQAAEERLRTVFERITRQSQVLNRSVATPSVRLEDHYTRSARIIESQNRNLNRMEANPFVRLRDRFTEPARRIINTIDRIGHRTVTVAIQARDMTGGIITKLISPLGLLGAGAGVYGVGKLTIGAAMDFEIQQVSMEHWLGGNKKAAQEVTNWLNSFAAKTPFEMGDLFPAMSRGIGISGGDISMAKQMVSLAGDMAALTPGKTVQDAMEALADAQMGEFERMKEFSMKMTQEEFKTLGGWVGFLEKAEQKFAGGAEKLSQTATGRFSTITDTIKTLFRQAGVGSLEEINPRLRKITDWFDKNEKTIERWKDSLVKFGGQAADAVLSKMERAFEYIRVRYLDNPEFQELSFDGKVDFIMKDISKALDKMVDDMNTWVSGPGGKRVEELFIKLAEIATRAWITALGGMAKGSVDAALHGNIIGSAGLAMGAGLLGGGMVLRGAWGAGRGLANAGRTINTWMNTRNAARIAALETTNPLAASIARATYGAGAVNAASRTTDMVANAANTASRSSVVAAAANTSAQNSRIIYGPSGNILREVLPAASSGAATPAAEIATSSRVLGSLGSGLSTASKVIGKLAWPLAIAGEAVGIAQAENKVTATGKAAFGLGGGWAGAEIGAGIGTAILPGIGTAIGGALGGLAGYIGGKWTAGKLFDKSPAADANEKLAKSGEAASKQQERIAQTGQVYLNSQGDIITSNGFVINSQNNLMQAFTTLAQAVDFASAKLIAFSGIKALEPIKTSVADFKHFDYEAHAFGGILTRPHLGLVAEAGPEAIIPLSPTKRDRAFRLWQQAGEVIGVKQYAMGGFSGTVPSPMPATDAVSGAPKIYLNFDLAGLVGQIIVNSKEELDGIVEQVASEIVKKLKSILNNIPK